MENMVVMLPSPGIGHLNPMVKLGELIVADDPSLSVTILLIPTTSAGNSIKTGDSITFHHLPTIADHPPSDSSAPSVDLAFQLTKLYKPIVSDTLLTISEKSTIKAVVIDFLSNDAFEVSKTLNIPSYYLYTGSAFDLGVMLYLRTIHNKISSSFKDMKTYIEFPGTPPIHSSDMPETAFDRNSDAYKNIINISTNMAKACGIIVNTFAGLEPRVMKAIADGEYIPDGPTPATYYVGPLIRTNSGDISGEDECLKWLNLQPSKSVVVLIFGSLGTFKIDQLTEMAKGLEKSGQRFLWVVRIPPSTELDDVLPAGFVLRNKEKGLIVKNWAPQGEILRHGSVGGFMCHCGWNSVLEALHAGVPMVAWPLYAEQKMNRVHLVEGMKVALPVKMSPENGFVTAEELSERLTELMESESGRELRKRVSEISQRAKAAMADGGSSRAAVAEFVASLKSVKV